MVYWMGRDQRVQDNWAMLYAQERAMEAQAPLVVCFNVADELRGEPVRHVGFMMEGLKEVSCTRKPSTLNPNPNPYPHPS